LNTNVNLFMLFLPNTLIYMIGGKIKANTDEEIEPINPINDTILGTTLAIITVPITIAILIP
jgi:hypothetical protein